MKQVWIPKHGSPDVLELREAPDPEVQAGEVRIRVAAAGINFADILARMGLYPDAPKLPTVMGYEVAGTIDQIGEDIERTPSEQSERDGGGSAGFARGGGDASPYKGQRVLAMTEVRPLIQSSATASPPSSRLTRWPRRLLSKLWRRWFRN